MRPQPPFDSEWCAGVWKGPQVVTHFVTAVTGREIVLFVVPFLYTSTSSVCGWNWALCGAVPVLSACASKGEFCKKCRP